MSGWFAGIRTARCREQLMWHLQQMESLSADRDAWESQGRHERVLSVNFEMVSHASRALGVLRELEELGDHTILGPTTKLRTYLAAHLALPNVPQHALGRTSQADIERLYAAYAGRGATADTQAPDIEAPPPSDPPMNNDRESRAEDALAVIGVAAFLRFVRAVRNAPACRAVGLLNDELDAGRSLDSLLFTGGEFGYYLEVTEEPPHRFLVALGYAAAPDGLAGDGARWRVTFDRDGEVVRAELLESWIH